MPKIPKKHKATRAYLRAYGYTPKTLAIDLDIPIIRATRILYDTGYLSFEDMERIRLMFGFYLSAMREEIAPGKVREHWARAHDNAKAAKMDIKDIKEHCAKGYKDLKEKETIPQDAESSPAKLYSESLGDYNESIKKFN